MFRGESCTKLGLPCQAFIVGYWITDILCFFVYFLHYTWSLFNMKHIRRHFVITVLCSEAVKPDRSCQVSVAPEKVYLSSSTSSDGNADVSCGSQEHPWSLEAPSGQRINIGLLDFSGSSMNSTVHRCERQFGFIEDKSANRNINICGDDAHRQPTLYVSKSNQVDIVLSSGEQIARNFLISVKGIQ